MTSGPPGAIPGLLPSPGAQVMPRLRRRICRLYAGSRTVFRAAEQAFRLKPESGHENLSAGNGQLLDMLEKSIRSNRR